ncbi:hypothetical protein ES332_D05G119800v1 [Gossypium tomentosum]|uniref:Uncharacterized protein n=1 Tax=Gossypium tomentosum TaxID=34277 RepID=A0A5D2KTG6_GOSTO|nr:hypothetical protein ES332_D05G119800v1 [Gossypium tomentosum]
MSLLETKRCPCGTHFWLPPPLPLLPKTHHFLLLHLAERNERRRIIEGLVGKMITVKHQLLRKNDIKNKDQE